MYGFSGAGHQLGGSMWKIGVSTEQILYAMHFNHKTEYSHTTRNSNYFCRQYLISWMFLTYDFYLV